MITSAERAVVLCVKVNEFSESFVYDSNFEKKKKKKSAANLLCFTSIDSPMEQFNIFCSKIISANLRRP